MRLALLLSFWFASLVLSKAIPDRDPVEHTRKPTKTKTCDCAKITDSADKLKRDGDMSKDCVTNKIVDSIINDYTYLLTQPGENPAQFNATATKLLTDDFQVYSDSILTLANITLGKGIPAYPSRDALLASQFRKGIAIPIIKTLDVFHTCDKIAWRCTASGLAKDILPVNMMFTFDVVPMDGQNSTVAPSPEPVPAAVTSTTADSTIGSPTNCRYPTACEDGSINANQTDALAQAVSTSSTTTTAAEPADTLIGQADTGSDAPGCAEGVSPDGDPNAGVCPARMARAKRHFAAIEDYERPQWKVKTVYSEFNTGAWIRDMGGECAMLAAG